MTTRAEAFAGLSVAITTPFADGAVDYDALKTQVEFQIAAGTGCLCPCGTTGESPTLSHEEHERVISSVVQTAAGRIKVMAGTGSNSTAEALRLTKWAAREGADAALVVAPYYNKPTQEGLYQHFKALAEAVDIPICVYNIPGRTGKNIEPETICRLAEISGIAMVKEAAGLMDQASRIICETDLTVLSGDDSLTLPLMALGGRGVVSVVGNIVPGDMLARPGPVAGLVGRAGPGRAAAQRLVGIHQPAGHRRLVRGRLGTVTPLLRAEHRAAEVEFARDGGAHVVHRIGEHPDHAPVCRDRDNYGIRMSIGLRNADRDVAGSHNQPPHSTECAKPASIPWRSPQRVAPCGRHFNPGASNISPSTFATPPDVVVMAMSFVTNSPTS